MSLGENICRLRTEKRMSQSDLADALEVSRQSVNKWETGSAVPELEKLMKMSRLFGISLDELASGEAPAPQTPPLQESQTQARGRFSRREWIGIVFWCFAALVILVYALSGAGFTGLLPAIPFLICGGLCFSKLRHLGLWCTWVFALPLIFAPFYEFIRIYEARLITVALWLGMLALTLWCLRNEPVKWSRHTKILLPLGYSVWFAYILFRILGQFGIWNLMLVSDRTIAYWLDAASYLMFIMLISVITRLLKTSKTK